MAGTGSGGCARVCGGDLFGGCTHGPGLCCQRRGFGQVYSGAGRAEQRSSRASAFKPFSTAGGSGVQHEGIRNRHHRLVAVRAGACRRHHHDLPGQDHLKGPRCAGSQPQCGAGAGRPADRHQFSGAGESGHRTGRDPGFSGYLTPELHGRCLPAVFKEQQKGDEKTAPGCGFTPVPARFWAT